MKEHIKILKKFKKYPSSVLANNEDNEKLMLAINKSIELLQEEDGRNKLISAINKTIKLLEEEDSKTYYYC